MDADHRCCICLTPVRENDSIAWGCAAHLGHILCFAEHAYSQGVLPPCPVCRTPWANPALPTNRALYTAMEYIAVLHLLVLDGPPPAGQAPRLDGPPPAPQNLVPLCCPRVLHVAGEDPFAAGDDCRMRWFPIASRVGGTNVWSASWKCFSCDRELHASDLVMRSPTVAEHCVVHGEMALAIDPRLGLRRWVCVRGDPDISELPHIIEACPSIPEAVNRGHVIDVGNIDSGAAQADTQVDDDDDE